MKTGQIRQGDVLLIPVDNKPPSDAAIVSEVVMAEGEVTGHAHRLRADQIATWNEGEQQYVTVLSSDAGEISHEDHDPKPVAVAVPGQTYEIRRQQEWDLSGEFRAVAD